MEKEISKEMDFSFKFEDGQVKIGLGYNGKGAGVEVVGSVSAEYFAQKLKDAIPGKIDDKLIDMLLAAIK